MKNADETAFPRNWGSGGLTKREYLAAMAMQGLLASLGDLVRNPQHVSVLAPDAVKCADALLTALDSPYKSDDGPA